MILTGSEIIKEKANGNIFISPYNKKMVNPNSYNYRLGPTLIELDSNVLDSTTPNRSRHITIPKSGYALRPNILYLGSTVEEIGSDMYVPSLIGRSSLGRLGLFLQITADLGHIGTKHNWTLELKVIQPLIVYANMIIGQVSFWKPEGLDLLEGLKYRDLPNNYAQYSQPHTSIPDKLEALAL